MEIDVEESDYRNPSEIRRDRKRTTVKPRAGGKLFRMGVLRLVLLCVLQATLIISLRLNLYYKLAEEQLQTSYLNLTEENGDLQASYIKLQTSYNTVIEDREQQNKEIGRLNERIRMLEERPCPQGWRKFGNSCYYASTEKKNWTVSRQDCLSRGADLVVIKSKNEQIFIKGLAGYRSEAWIGLSEREGIWTWVDGTPLTTTYWMRTEPDGGNQDCVEFYFNGKGQLGEWFDEPCSIEYKWICEK